MRRKLLNYLRERAGEASTWRGLVVIATALGAHLSPEQAEAIVVAGLGVSGLIGAVLPDGRK